MRRFSLVIDTCNAAFDDEDCPQEVARILREVAEQLETAARLPEVLRLYDLNGNHVGEVKAR